MNDVGKSIVKVVKVNVSYYRNLSLVIIINTHRCNRINNYKIIVNVVFKTFSNGDFQIELVSNTMVAILDKTMYMHKRT